jgi:glycosyltransferase involved in cell wall biosynthesis
MLPISVIMAVYNGEKYLRQALDSILNQTQSISEIIVINDGSTDNTSEILNDYKSNIKVINRENKGPAYSVNEGISISKNDWLCFLDADDLWTNNKLENQYKFSQANPIVKVFLGLSEQFLSDELTEEQKSKIALISNPQKGILRSTMLVHRSIFEKTSLFDTTLVFGEFIDWFTKLKEHNIPYLVQDELFHKRRLHPNSLTSNKEHLSDFAKLIKRKLDRERENK